jgi:hypothetical protein
LKETAGVVVINPGETRWSSRCFAYTRLLDVKDAIQIVFQSDRYLAQQDKVIFQGNAKSVATAHKMASIVNDPQFWYNLLK